jgi:hypothetical protein
VGVDVRIGSGIGGIRAVTDEEGLRFESRRTSRQIRWESVTGGGLARGQNVQLEAMGPEAANVLPGLSRVAEASQRLTASRRLLLLAEARPHGRPRAFLMPIQIDDPNAEILLAEVRRRLGERWRGEDWELRALKRELGATYPRWYLPVGILLVLFVAGVTIFAIAGWGQLTEDKSLATLVPWLLVGVAAWLGFVALLFFLARGAVGKDEWRPWAVAAPLALALAMLGPAAVATYGLAADWKLDELEPSMLVVLAVWLGLAAFFVSYVRRRLG